MRPSASGQPAADFRDAGAAATQRTDELMRRYRKLVSQTLEPLVRGYHPEMLAGARDEYRKMLELSTKMSLVGHACTEIAGFAYDERRQMIGALFGACCFLADSFSARPASARRSADGMSVHAAYAVQAATINATTMSWVSISTS